MKNVPSRCPKAEREHKVKIKHHETDGDDDRDGDKAGKPNNHGQNVSAFTNATPLPGADEGAAVIAMVRSARGGEHSARGGRAVEQPHGRRARRCGALNGFDYGRALGKSRCGRLWHFTAVFAVGSL